MGCNGVAWIYDRLTPLPIDHRSMLHCYAFPCQLTIYPCYTITPPCQLTIHPCNTVTPHNFLLSLFLVVNLQLTICMQFKCSFSIIVIFICNCCHVATDHLHEYIHFTIYHLELHFWCSEAQAISAISPKTCTLKLQLLHNTKRPTKWSGHVKMIDPP